MGEAKEGPKKAFKMPHTLVIIFMIILRRSCLPGSCRPAPMCVLRDAVTGRNLIDPEASTMSKTRQSTPEDYELCHRRLHGRR